MKQELDEKIILVYFGNKDVNMLIPKKRGHGYLKQPIGHHNCPLADLSRDIGYDFFGLDGYLEVPNRLNKDKNILTQQVVIPVSNFYGYRWQEVGIDTFFETLRSNK
jgi:hypothetical protein